MRTLEGIIKSILDLTRDEMIEVLEHEDRHAEAAARVFAPLQRLPVKGRKRTSS
jgi:hypothetical protein